MHCVHPWANVGGVVFCCFVYRWGVMTSLSNTLHQNLFCRGSEFNFYSFDQAWSNGMVEMSSERWSWNWYPKGWTWKQQTWWPGSWDSTDCWKNDGNLLMLMIFTLNWSYSMKHWHGYRTRPDTDTWTPVKHIKFNPDTSVGVVSVSVSCRTPDTARGWGVRAS